MGKITAMIIYLKLHVSYNLLLIAQYREENWENLWNNYIYVWMNQWHDRRSLKAISRLTTSDDESFKAEECSSLEPKTFCVDVEGADNGVCFLLPFNQAADPKGTHDVDFLTALLPLKLLPACNKVDWF